MKAFVFSSMAVLFLQGAAFAQSATTGLDADKDGKISKEEAKNDKELSSKFDEADANKDGFLDKDELKSLHSQNKEKAPQ